MLGAENKCIVQIRVTQECLEICEYNVDKYNITLVVEKSLHWGAIYLVISLIICLYSKTIYCRKVF